MLGFVNMLVKLLQETEADHLAVIFDAGRRTFRNDIYADYKAHRPPPPDELIPQFALIREAVRAFEVACIESEGWEADDLIASYARVARGGRRRGDHRLLRQGPDAADPRRASPCSIR